MRLVDATAAGCGPWMRMARVGGVGRGWRECAACGEAGEGGDVDQFGRLKRGYWRLTATPRGR